MCGWMAQKYSTVPTVENTCENLSSVSSAGERNFPSFSDTTCGMSSAFTQVTVVPALTVKVGGSKVKLAILTCASAASACPLARPARTTRRRVSLALRARLSYLRAILPCHLPRKRCVGDGQRLIAGAHIDACDAEHGAELLGRHGHGAR